MPSDEEKRRKSIAYILRRRKRGRKVGANSGETVKSWAEYSEVNFTPKGAYASHWRWLMLPGWIFAASIPWIFLGIALNPTGHHPENLAHPELGPLGWVLLVVAALLIVAICTFAVAYVGVSIWRFIRSHLPHKNE